MKIKNRDLFNFVSAGIGSKRLPTRLAFIIALNAEEASKMVKICESERTKLAEKHAKKDENGKPIIEDGQYIFENEEAWNKDIQELFDTEVDCNMSTVSLDDVAKCDESDFDNLTVHEISLIRFMIEN